MDENEVFERQRPVLRGLAYRMLGSVSEADDVVQDTWLRWQASEPGSVRNVSAFLTRVASNLCLDRLKSARARRERYVGPWLPEPVIDAAEMYAPDPEAHSELADDLSYALMLAMERLSPSERAAFILHDVFDVPFAEVGAILSRDSAACRQLAVRARRALKAEAPRRVTTPAAEDGQALAMAFAAAAEGGDLASLVQLLADDAVFVTDGGGKVAALSRPLTGALPIAKAMAGFAKRYRSESVRYRYALINGLDGFVTAGADGVPLQTIAIEFDDAGQVRCLYVVRNPEKLAHVGAVDGTDAGCAAT